MSTLTSNSNSRRRSSSSSSSSRGYAERGGTNGSRRRTPSNTLNSNLKAFPSENPPGADGTVRTSTSIHLPAEQQLELARCVKSWVACKETKKEREEMIGRPLSFEEWAVAVGMEEKTLRRQIEDGKAARELLIKTNINLIKSMAVRLYARQEKNENRLSVDDLVLEGTQGILKAAAKFDPTRNIRFTTYAVWWIRQAISLAIQTHSNTVRLPVLLQARIKKIKEARLRLYLLLEREPTHEEVGKEIGLPAGKVESIRRKGGRGRLVGAEEEWVVVGMAMGNGMDGEEGREEGVQQQAGEGGMGMVEGGEGPLVVDGKGGETEGGREERRKLEAFKKSVVLRLKEGDREVIETRWKTYKEGKGGKDGQPAVSGRRLKRIQGELRAMVWEKDLEDRRDVFSSMRLCMA
ncbi:rna polymerase sigma factor [Nannochloropsis oceanica]